MKRARPFNGSAGSSNLNRPISMGLWPLPTFGAVTNWGWQIALPPSWQCAWEQPWLQPILNSPGWAGD